MKFTSVLKQHKLFVALCLVVFCAGLAQSQDAAGPAVGETIDLRSFQTRTGVTLFDAMKQHSIALLVIVDPNCGTCTSVQDSLRALRERVGKTQMAYYVVMIPDGSDPQKYFSFADSLKLDIDSFVCNSTDAKPGSLAAMLKPAHLQITNEGLIVQKWPGIPQNTSTP
jgi:type IV pilus biogenesis protein CpaD/CtpE